MKYILFFTVFIFTYLNTNAQTDTLFTFYNDKWEEIEEAEKATYFGKMYKENNLYTANDYYINGQLQMRGSYVTKTRKTKEGIFEYFYKDGQIRQKSTYKTGKLNGESLSWYKDGVLKRIINYKENQFHGELKTYWSNGQLKREDFYKKGKLKKGKVWDSLGVVQEYYPFEEMPEFNGGQVELLNYLTQNIKYPIEAKKAGISGRVIIQFLVNEDGSISHTKVVKGVDPLLDKEALRVVKNMPNWIPGHQDGIPVKVTYNVPVRFSL